DQQDLEQLGHDGGGQGSQQRHVGEKVVHAALLERAAVSVLTITMATVMGPVPPGMGVSQPATLPTSGWTSPTMRPSTRVSPTSSTAAPGLTISGAMRRGLPAATTSTSAWRVTAARSGVRE